MRGGAIVRIWYWQLSSNATPPPLDKTDTASSKPNQMVIQHATLLPLQLPEKEETPAVSDPDTTTEVEPDPAAYQHLEVNTKLDNDKDWVGILHKATHTFTGEKAGDLCFNEGDTVTVYQILENDWWLGSKDDVVGWFPRSYVEVSITMKRQTFRVVYHKSCRQKSK